MPVIEKTDFIYRYLNDSFENGVLACGFMKKPTQASSQINFTIDYYSCLVIISGKGIYRDKNNRCIHLEKGDIVQRIPGTIHSTEILPDGEWSEFFINLGKPIYDYLVKLSIINPDKPVLKNSFIPDEEKSADFRGLLNDMKNADSIALKRVLISAQNILLDILKESFSLETPKIISKSHKIEEACEILSSDFGREINYRNLAASLNISYENFRKIFREEKGTSPGRYRNIKKMQQATLMINSGVSIKETAIYCGYSDVFAFSKQFKKTMGVSPGKTNQLALCSLGLTDSYK